LCWKIETLDNVLGLEVSRLARNNADWHRLIELGGLTDTLIGPPSSTIASCPGSRAP